MKILLNKLTKDSDLKTGMFPMALNSVKVLFADSKYNYETNVSAQTTEITAMQYFVGKRFNVGCYPVEDMQQCIGIEFTDNNL